MYLSDEEREEEEGKEMIDEVWGTIFDRTLRFDIVLHRFHLNFAFVLLLTMNLSISLKERYLKGPVRL